MLEAGLVLRVIAILLALACYGSFTWAIIALFRHTGPTPAVLRWLGMLATVFFVLQIGALIVRASSAWLVIVGIALYTISLALFWWAVPYARQARLALAFTELQSAVVIRSGPYRWVRHPFYAAYLLFWIAGTVGSGDPWLLISVIVMAAFYLSAIRREEQELLGRTDLQGYADYRARTGCLLPWWR